MGRSSREDAAANRERVVEAAGRLMREHGLAGVSVADVMAAAGMTHGGFYRHFASKSDLVAEAVAGSLEETAREWREEATASGLDGRQPRALERIVWRYLSEAHRDAPGEGCALAALGAEAGRLPPEARAQVASGAEAMVAALAEAITESDPAATTTDGASTGLAASNAPEAREQALVALSTMLGALLLARLGVGQEAGRGVLEVARAEIIGEATCPRGES